jgi:hypothetical protein
MHISVSVPIPSQQEPVASTPAAATCPRPSIQERDGQHYTVVEDYDRIAPFFCALTTDAGLWLYVSSTGGLTCGREDPDGAILPYGPVDKIHDSISHSGPVAILRWRTGAGWRHWQPFNCDCTAPGGTRRLLKNTLGTRIVFTESLPAGDLLFSAAWTLSERFGLIRECRLRNTGAQHRQVGLLHGLRNVLASGMTRSLQDTYSCLADAYKQNEIRPPSGLGLYTMASQVSDQPAPAESLRATVVWSAGLGAARHSVDPAAINTFRQGGDPLPVHASRGVRGHYLEWADLDLAPGQEITWLLVADTRLDHAAVSAIDDLLCNGESVRAVATDVRRCEAGLRRHLAAADGLQHSADQIATAHHLANVLFNIMRGGIFPDGYAIERDDFLAFVDAANRPLAAAHAARLRALPARIQRQDLRQVIAGSGDPQLVRLFLEYLPLTFSRRHGDPSRPWNQFAVRVRDARGRSILAYQGNWRDIFQNWETLALSFPEYADSMISKFVNASTVDGHNPYRITRDGIDWEEPEADNPWAGFGYWGDHQIIYLLKLLEWSERHDPDQLPAMLEQRLFSYANVPYRIRPYQDILQDPRNTLDCDHPASRRLRAAAARDGSDQKLILDATGQPVLVGLAEKLLVPLLAKWCHFVPGGGIWMNTQRPEWNDANNALVGNGLSVVTLCYLRRHHGFLARLFRRRAASEFTLTAAVADWLRATHAILAAHDPAEACAEPAARRALLDQLGEAGCRYRARAYAGAWRETTTVAAAEIIAFLAAARAWIDATIERNRRADGLYHAYNLLRLAPGAAHLSHLAPMLEGQVAVLSSGLLAPAACAELLACLRASPLYCPRRNSYMLYPDRPATAFMDRNRVDPAAANTCSLLATMLERGDQRILIPDPHASCLRFHPELHNQGVLAERLRALPAEDAYSGFGADAHAQVLALYEAVFQHHAFTGRSGSMFAYEGLGSIYWHMVAKLLLAVQEVLQHAVHTGATAATCARLDAHYEAIRDGLGFRKSAHAYGAFPTDPYSHSPAHAGAQQPGMTGQVKEEILTRRGELGVEVDAGRLSFNLVHRLIEAEFTHAPGSYAYVDSSGQPAELPLPAGCLAYTLCQTPVVCHRPVAGAQAAIRIHWADGRSETVAGNSLTAGQSHSIFSRAGRVRWLEVTPACRGATRTDPGETSA